MAKKPVLLITHVTEGDPGQIPVILAEMDQPYRVMRANKGEQFPSRNEGYAGFVSFGGPQSANDDHIDYIRAELDWLSSAISAGVPLLGICLGGQLISRVLGGKVAPHPEGMYEFGYYPIEPLDGAPENLVLDSELHVALRHGEAFTIPHGAKRLARRPIFGNQAYRYGTSTWALQFHPEVNGAVLNRWLKQRQPPEDLNRKGAQTVQQQIENHALHHKDMHVWLGKFLALWLGSKVLGR